MRIAKVLLIVLALAAVGTSVAACTGARGGYCGNCCAPCGAK
jgi:hypothetical protein